MNKLVGDKCHRCGADLIEGDAMMVAYMDGPRGECGRCYKHFPADLKRVEESILESVRRHTQLANGQRYEYKTRGFRDSLKGVLVRCSEEEPTWRIHTIIDEGTAQWTVVFEKEMI